MNIFILGAGFSKPAGLPLGDALWVEILKVAKSKGLYENNLEDAIYEYIDYYHGVNGEKISEKDIKLEKFMSYWDIDRQLALKGGDYTAPEETIKILLAYVLHDHQKRITEEQFALYEQFVERLDPYDLIFTFNYDTILEKSLTRKSIPYRLYSSRLRHDEKSNSLALDWKDEIVIFKVHGSMNWFDKTAYDETKALWERFGDDKKPQYAVFDGRISAKVSRLLDEPFKPDDPFRNIYVLEDLEDYFDIHFDKSQFSLSQAPFIIPPSYHKLTNLNYLISYWYRFSNMINRANKIVIIGFSLPEHDEYIRQPIYWFIKNFHKHGEPIEGKKAKLKIIDYKKDQKELDEFKANYRFVDENMTNFYFGGFCKEALDIIFSEE